MLPQHPGQPCHDCAPCRTQPWRREARAGILDITAISKADAILSGEGNPMAVRLNSSNSQDGAVIANYIANVAKAGRIAFLTQNDAYGNGAQASIENELKCITSSCVSSDVRPFSHV